MFCNMWVMIAKGIAVTSCVCRLAFLSACVPG